MSRVCFHFKMGKKPSKITLEWKRKSFYDLRLRVQMEMTQRLVRLAGKEGLHGRLGCGRQQN